MNKSLSHPAVFSVLRQLKLNDQVSGSDLAAGLVLLIESIQEWAVSNNYLVGHIKAFVEEGGQTLRISATKGPPDIHRSPGWENIVIDSFTINLAAIVFGPDSQQLGRIITSRLEHWVDSFHKNPSRPR